MIQIVTLSGVTDGSGDAVVTSPKPVTGKVLKVEIDGTQLADSANLVLVGLTAQADGDAEAGESIVNHGDIGNAALNNLYPRVGVQDNAGTALTLEGTELQTDYYVVAGAKLRATISGGGAAKGFNIRVVLVR